MEGCFKVVANCMPSCFAYVDKHKKMVEKWKRQNKHEGEVYDFVGLEGDGVWLDTLEKKGADATRKLIKERLYEFVYNQGEGQFVESALRAKSRDKYAVDLSEVRKGFHHRGCKLVLHGGETTPRVVGVPDLKVCWSLEKRGEVGETPFHICFLLDSPQHRRLASLLLEVCPSLCMDVYEAPEYQGESALHLAIVNGSFPLVKKLVQCGADVHQRAVGRFFLPEDQKDRFTGRTNYIGYAYYGELPLSFAASFGRTDIYDFLLEQGASPEKKDVFGNTVLHLAVIHNQIKMFGHALKLGAAPAHRADLLEKNQEGLDPLVLAAKMGHDKMFNEVLYHHSKTLWKWVDIRCSTYSLESLDTITSEGKTNSKSALQYIIDNESEGHLAMLDNPVVNQLIEQKWIVYGRWYFLMRLCLALVHLTCLSVTIWTRPGRYSNWQGPTDTTSIVRYVAECILMLSCISHLLHYLTIQLGLWKIPKLLCSCRQKQANGEPMAFADILKEFHSPLYAPFKIIFMISCAVIIVAFVFRLFGNYGAEATCLAIATPASWSYLLFFARSTRLLGPFVVMIYKMCITDIVRFTIIYLVFLIQFSQAFYFMHKDPDDPHEQYNTLPGTMMALIHMTLGDFQFEELSNSHVGPLAKVVFLVFCLLVPLLLLNMLIAMMGNTYELIISGANCQWKRQWAQIMLVLEHTIPHCSLGAYLREYGLPFSDTCDRMAIMVTREDQQP